ncbi:MAG: carbohydrate ABC transporter permease [Lachnospiraceae bacterium]|nr:carbohydrate ABC transporter permease [Lachnospiraceae bacterium]
MAGRNKGFGIFADILMAVLALGCIIPFILLLAASITDEATLTMSGYAFIPKKVSFEAYAYLFNAAAKIGKAYAMTIAVTLIGTAANLFLTISMAYLLSKKDLPGRNFLSFFVFFTMLFSGGMVPSYIVWGQYMHVKDSIWGLILPNLMLSGFNIILMRTYFTSNIPNELYEAADMDACSEIGKLIHVALPLSKPMLATVGLFAGLAYWNDWINGIYYLIKRTDLYTIQNMLNTMMNNVQFLKTNALTAAEGTISQIPTSGVRMAIAVIAAIPVLVVYPFFQRFFIRGIVIGGVKG